MNRREIKHFYWKLFWATFTLSAFTFGGGFVMIPLMRKKFVLKLHWLSEEEMLDITAISQSTPGAMAVNASILIGYRLAGFSGAAVTLFATILPPLGILSLVSLGYAAFRDNIWVAKALKGMQAGIAAIVADVVLDLGSEVGKQKNLVSIFVMLAVFVGLYFFKINMLLIIAISAAIGVAQGLWRRRVGKAL